MNEELDKISIEIRQTEFLLVLTIFLLIVGVVLLTFNLATLSKIEREYNQTLNNTTTPTFGNLTIEENDSIFWRYLNDKLRT